MAKWVPPGSRELDATNATNVVTSALWYKGRCSVGPDSRAQSNWLCGESGMPTSMDNNARPF